MLLSSGAELRFSRRTAAAHPPGNYARLSPSWLLIVGLGMGAVFSKLSAAAGPVLEVCRRPAYLLYLAIVIAPGENPAGAGEGIIWPADDVLRCRDVSSGSTSRGWVIVAGTITAYAANRTVSVEYDYSLASLLRCWSG